LDILLDTNALIGSHGTVIVAATYRPTNFNNSSERRERRHSVMVTSYYALDALNGEIIWSHIGKSLEERYKIKTTKQLRISSIARRRSGLTMDTMDDAINSEECLLHYRHWILHSSSNALPHTFWDTSLYREGLSEESKLFIAHFDKKQHYRKDRHYGRKTINKSKRATIYYDRPNVVLFHNHNGLDVVSLHNGRRVCHLSLFASGLYADINNDGVIDHLQVVTDIWKPSSYGRNPIHISSHKISHSSDKFTENMTKRIQESKSEDTTDTETGEYHLCHALLLSGIPVKEELFSIPLYNGISVEKQGVSQINAAMPLLLETLNGHTGRPMQDIVFALNNGMVMRYDSHGILQWNTKPHATPILPHWDEGNDDGKGGGFLDRIDFQGTISSQSLSAIRPILLAGNDGMSILSSGRGTILAHVGFPQLSLGKPILFDANGDGTTDVLIVSVDGIWCYRVAAGMGRSTWTRVIMILLIIGIGVAVLCQQHSGNDYRGTDEYIHEHVGHVALR